MAQLHFWQTVGDAKFADRALACAEDLVTTAVRRAEGIVWPIPASFDSALRGITHYGFAHGVAGVGTFLLSAGRILGRSDLLDLARSAGATLANVAVREDASAWWPSGEQAEGETSRLWHWCSGSSGVGTFLIRLWQATGDAEPLELSRCAASAVHRSRWRSSTANCHGLTGDGEFLLDMADLTGEPTYRQWAADLADCLRVRAALREGRYLVPDESGLDITAGHGTGLAGVLAFLLRLEHGGPRLWIPEPKGRKEVNTIGWRAERVG
jgi:rhamnogalacturonyl hydrolase YesR